MKQKIDMMDNFRVMKAETLEKLKRSQEVEEKLQARLRKLEAKED